MKHLFLIIFLNLFFSVLSKAQNIGFQINSIGFLGENNQFAYCGGMGQMDILLKKSKVKGQKIILKGRLIDKYTEDIIPYYSIFVAEKDENQLIIKRNLNSTKNNIDKKNALNSFDFNIKVKLKKEEKLYFESLAYGMLEIELNLKK